MRYISGCDPIKEMCDRYRKISREKFGRKRKSTEFIYLPGSKFREAEGYLKMRSRLQDAVINYAPSIGKLINKMELYRQCPPRRVKDTKMTDI